VLPAAAIRSALLREGVEELVGFRPVAVSVEVSVVATTVAGVTNVLCKTSEHNSRGVIIGAKG
jgi:hypothetical protein